MTKKKPNYLGFVWRKSSRVKAAQTLTLNSKKKWRNLYIRMTSKIEVKRGEKSLRKFTTSEIKLAIKQLNRKTSLDNMGISNRMLKHLPLSGISLFKGLVNDCLENKVVPSVWRESIVTMLQKKEENPSDPSNYRPISITSCLARLFEKLILERLNAFLNSNNIIIDQQSGFRRKRQTKDNLAMLIQKTNEAFKKGKSVVAVFFDIQSAFDKVWHEGLLYKLVKLKVPHYLVRIVEAFLRERTFVVKVNGMFSSVKMIRAGVPQGGVLSPTLFSIYINDCPKRKVKNKRYTLLFADDLMYFEIFKNKTPSLERRINHYLEELLKWSTKWRLTLAVAKCVYTVFSKKQMIDEFNLKLNGLTLIFDEAPKFLGVFLDTKLNFTKHLKYIEEKCNDRMGIIKALAFGHFKLPFWVLRSLYKSLIRSLMEYTSFISSLINKKDLNKLQVIQNKCLRLICGRDCSTTTEELHEVAGVSQRPSRKNDKKTHYQ